MATRRRSAGPKRATPPGWTVSETWTHNGRNVEPGTEVTVAGEGRFRFLRHVRTDKGREWIDAVSTSPHDAALRSFRPDRVRTVHRKTKARAPRAA